MMHAGFNVSNDLFLCCHLLQSLWGMELVSGASFNCLFCVCALNPGDVGEVPPKAACAYRSQQLKDDGTEQRSSVGSINGKLLFWSVFILQDTCFYNLSEVEARDCN